MEQPKKEFYTALSNAQSTLGGLTKDARQEKQGWEYLTGERIIAEVNSALRRWGLVLTCVGSEMVSHNSTMTTVIMSFRYQLVHAATCQGIEFGNVAVVEQTRARTWDKAIPTMSIQSLKDVLRGVAQMAKCKGQEAEEQIFKPMRPEADDKVLSEAMGSDKAWVRRILDAHDLDALTIAERHAVAEDIREEGRKQRESEANKN